MNKKIWASLACASLLLSLATGCSEETALVGTDTGYISLALDFDPNPVRGSRADRSRADETTRSSQSVSELDLTLTLSRDDGALPPEELTVDLLNTPKNVYTGDYTLEATYGSKGDEGWDTPYFYGSQSITVRNNTETRVSLPVRLANAMISIVYSENFTTHLTDYKVTVTSSSGSDFEWNEDNIHELFVIPGSVLLTVDFTKPNGSTATLQMDPFEAEARHHYVVTLDVDYQSETLTVSTDDTVVSKEFDIDISDANLPNLSPRPILLPAEGFTPGATITTVAGDPAQVHLGATIVARGGIASATLEFKSDYLSSLGLTSPVDLTQTNEILNKLGIMSRGFDNSRDVFATIDFTGILSKVPYIENSNNISTFNLIVTDPRGQVNELTELFTLNVERISVEILSGSTITEDGKAELIVSYNGTNPNDITINSLNDRGGKDYIPIVSWKPETQNGIYRLMLESKYITLNSPLDILAKTPFDDNETHWSYFTLEVPPIRTMDNAVNAFAKYAYVTILFTSEEATEYKDKVRFEVSSDADHKIYTSVASEYVSDNFSNNTPTLTATYKLTGLTPATNYVYHAVIDGVEISESAVLNTEVAAQILYADMENWDIQAGDSKYWWKSYLGESAATTPWGTMNLITTSAGGSSTNMFNHNGCAYVARSGTDRISDPKSGQYAAVVKTIGWGYSDANGKMNAKNVTAGSLHLGTSPSVGNEPVYGWTFESRPSALKFWYKYAPRNPSDYGYVEFWLKDDQGNVIISDKKNITSQPDYIEFTDFKFDYTVSAPKAKQICVIFKSSNNPNCITATAENLTTPPFGNLSDANYEGAIFTIDDIELVY